MAIDYFTQRKTIRQYSTESVSSTLLNEIIEAASQAPTTGNMQLYSVVCTRNKGIKDMLSPAHFNQPMVKNAPIVLTFCADFNRFTKWCEKSNAIPGYDNFQSFICAVLDVTIFAQQFVTIAEMKGLGTCYLGTTTYNAKQIANILNLPKRVVPILTVTLGWPSEDCAANKSDRLPLKGILHEEKYNDYCDNEIADIYRTKETLDENIKFIKENDKETLAQVFTDIRYTKANNEFFSKEFYEFIKEQLFDFPVK